MRRRAKRAKTKTGAKRSRVAKALKAQPSGDRGLEKRLAEALDEQTATREILQVIGRSRSDVQPVFEAIVDSAVQLCGADIGNVTRFDGEWVHLATMHADAAGIDRLRKLFPARPSGALASLRSIRDRSVAHIPDVLEDKEYKDKQAARAAGFRAVLSVPMLRDGQAIGSLSVGRAVPGAFSDRQIALLKTFADQAVIAIENVRLFQELEARNGELMESLGHQSATVEILRVISGSPTDVQPVFDTIAKNAARLCEAQFCFVFRFDGELLHFVAHQGVTAEGVEAVRRGYPMAPSRGSAAARAVLDRSVVEIPDVLVEPDFAFGGAAKVAGYRSAIAVPMLRDGLPIGSISVARALPGLFPSRQIALLKTFADQAVIAIENVRLFKELEARTSELSRSVEQLTALSDISRAVSSTLDVETVLDTIVSHASQLAGGAGCAIYEYDESGEQFELRATHGYEAGFVEALRASPLRKGEGLMGRAAEMHEPIQYPCRCSAKSRSSAACP